MSIAGPTVASEEIAGSPEFRHLSTIAGIAVELRYATADNFVGRDLYSPFDCAWLHRDAAAALERVVAWLAERRPGCTPLVLDALRPQRVQEAIWASVAGTDMAMYFAEPKRGSIHSFGMAVDVTLVAPDGTEADMGSGFDEMTLRSHPALHTEHLRSGVLQPAHVAERGWLADAMAAGGFHGIPTEWWHFDHGDRDRVRHELPRVW